MQHQLPWQLKFSQKLGRHAIAGRHILAGQCVLAEQAVQAVPTQGQERSSCHSCLKPLPEGGNDLQLSQGVLLDKASKHYKRYCSLACSQADCTASSTAPLHARIPQIAAETKCDPTLMHFILELDAQRPHQTSNPVSSLQHEQPAGKAPQSTEAPRKDSPDVISCTLADVEALLSPFDQNQKGWRDAITAGELHTAHTQLLQLVSRLWSPCNLRARNCHTAAAVKGIGAVCLCWINVHLSLMRTKYPFWHSCCISPQPTPPFKTILIVFCGLLVYLYSSDAQATVSCSQAALLSTRR